MLSIPRISVTNIFISLVLIAAIGVIVLLHCMFTSDNTCTWSPIAGTHSSVTIDNNTLTITGNIDDGLVNDVQAQISRSSSLIKRIRITSYGGVNDSMTKLVAAIAMLGPIPIDVPTTCQSACIGFLANTPGPKHIAPSATLMFHSASITSGPPGNTLNCWCWRFPDWVVNTASSHRHDMLAWAAQLNQHLPTLFSLCPINPLDTQRGMFLTGQEYNDLHDSHITPASLTVRCPSDRS